MSSTVDAFWAQLKSTTAPKPGLLRKKENACVPTTSATGCGNAPGSLAQPAAEAAGGACTLQPQWQHSPGSIRQHATRLIEGLKSDTTSVRQKSCSGLKEVVQFLKSSPDVGEDPSALLADLLESSLGKMLLRRFDDSSQTCRELCVGTFVDALQASPGSVLALLPYAMPVLEERLCRTGPASGQITVVEECEEVRLLLSQLVVLLVRTGAKALGAYASEVVGLMESMLGDPFHEVNMAGCEALVALNEALGLRLSGVSKRLVAVALPLTTHKRHRVRVAAIEAVRATMHQSAHEMILEMIAWRDPNVVSVAAFYGDDLKVNFAGKLATDPHPMVRLAWVLTLRDWMLHLRERVDHEPRLLPYLLSALTDPAPSVSEAAVEALDALGEAYQVEHAKEIEEATSYLPPDAQGLGGQLALMRAHTQQRQLLRIEGAEPTTLAVEGETGTLGHRRWPTGVSLPPALTRPWGLGATRLVQGQAGRSLHALTCEMFTWQSDSRRNAATLLRTMLALAGNAAHQHVQQLVPALCRAMPDPEIRSLALDCMVLLGSCLPPQLLLDLLLPRLTDTSADMPVQAGIMQLITAVLRGAGGRPELYPCMPGLMDVLDGPHGCMVSGDSVLRGAGAGYLIALVQAMEAACRPYMTRLVVAALHLSTNPNATDVATLEDFPYIPTSSSSSSSSTATAIDALGTTAAAAAAGRPLDLLQQLAASAGAASARQLVSSCLADMLAGCHPAGSRNPALTAAVLGRLMLAAAQPQQAVTPAGPAQSQSMCSAQQQPLPADPQPANPGCSSSKEGSLQQVLACVQCAVPLLRSGPSRSGELLMVCLHEALGWLGREGSGPGAAGEGTALGGTSHTVTAASTAAAAAGPAGVAAAAGSARAAATSPAGTLRTARVLSQVLQIVTGRALELAVGCVGVAIQSGWITPTDLLLGVTTSSSGETHEGVAPSGDAAAAQPPPGAVAGASAGGDGVAPLLITLCQQGSTCTHAATRHTTCLTISTALQQLLPSATPHTTQPTLPRGTTPSSPLATAERMTLQDQVPSLDNQESTPAWWLHGAVREDGPLYRVAVAMVDRLMDAQPVVRLAATHTLQDLRRLLLGLGGQGEEGTGELMERVREGVRVAATAEGEGTVRAAMQALQTDLEAPSSLC